MSMCCRFMDFLTLGGEVHFHTLIGHPYGILNILDAIMDSKTRSKAVIFESSIIASDHVSQVQ